MNLFLMIKGIAIELKESAERWERSFRAFSAPKEFSNRKPGAWPRAISLRAFSA